MEDGVEEAVVEVSDGELLLKNVCWVLEQEGRSETVAAVYEHEVEESGGADWLVEKRCV